jgi:hypothetical protein
LHSFLLGLLIAQIIFSTGRAIFLSRR